MLTETPLAPTPVDHRDRSGYVWLLVAAVLFAFSAGRWTFAPAAWLAPLFLLHFLRKRAIVSGLLLALLARYLVAATVVLPGTVLLTGARYYLSVLLIIAAAMLPYAADRLLTPRLPGFAATLVFPVALVSLEYLTSFGPTGTINSLANSQYGDLPLMQLASVTGIWGISFLIGWFASVVDWAWERGFVWPRIRTGTALYAAVLVVVFLGGAARVALTSPAQGIVRVAAISASKSAVAATSALLTPSTMTPPPSAPSRTGTPCCGPRVMGCLSRWTIEVRSAGPADYFTAPDRQVLTATLPRHGVRTVYSRIGDLFAWACLAGLLLLATAARPHRVAAPVQQRRARDVRA